MTRVLIVVDKHNGSQRYLERQLEVSGIPYIIWSVAPFSWRKKLEAELWLAQSRPDDLLITLDGWDVMMNTAPVALSKLEIQGFFDDRVIIPADLACWPNRSLTPRFQGSGWKFVNGMGAAGKGRMVAAALETMRDVFGLDAGETNSLYDPEGTDQSRWTSLYLDWSKELKLFLDTDTRLTMAMSGSTPGKDYRIENGKLVNNYSGVTPIFAHFNNQLLGPLRLEGWTGFTVEGVE